MKIKLSVILSFIVLIFNIILSHLFYSEANEFLLSTFLVIFDTIFIGIILCRKKENKSLYVIIFLSLILRIFLMYFELYGRNIFVLPNSGRDTEAFYTLPFESSFSSLNGYFLFIRILGSLFCKQRIMFQFVNVIFSVLVDLIVLKIFDKLNLGKKAKLFGILLISLLPSNMILSAELLREELMILINTISLYYFIDWYLKGKLSNFVIACLLVVLSAYFHSSMVIMIFGYFYAFIFYNRKTNSNVYSVKTFGRMVLAIGLFILFYVLFYSYINSYFYNIGDIEYLNDKLSYYAEGNSVYLANLAHANSLFELILTSPIKFFYLFASPVPWEWRSIVDICIFMLSSIFYILPFKNFLKKKSPLVKFLFVIVIIIGFTYGLSCFSVGSAMRHREKALPFVCLLIALLINEKGDKNEI